MMKNILIILFCFLGVASFGQVMQNNTTPGGYQWVAVKGDSMMIIPRGTDTVNIGATKYGKPTIGNIFYKTTDSTLWIRSANKWNRITGGGSGANNYTTAISFGTGTGLLTLSRDGLGNLTADFDGRYLRLSDTSAFAGNFIDTAYMVSDSLKFEKGATSWKVIGGNNDSLAFNYPLYATPYVGNVRNVYLDTTYFAPILPDGLYSGGLVSWAGTGLKFDVTSATYRIQQAWYTSAADSFTLTAADATFDRKDVPAVNTNSNNIVIIGTPAAAPITPQADPATQIALTDITVAAGATTPAGVTQTIFYNINAGSPTEANWATGAGLTVSYSNLVNPYNATHAIDINSWLNTGTRTITGTWITTIDRNSQTLLKMYIDLKADLPATSNIAVRFFNGTTAVTGAYILTGANGFTKTDVGYQNVTIPLSAIVFPTTTFDRIQISFTGAGPGMWLDYIQLQGGINPGGGGNGTLTNLTATNNYGQSWTITNPTTTPNLSLLLDTTKFSTRAWRDKLADSLGVIIATKGTGTVTNVATGLGLSGGPITTTGTIILDTASASVISRQRAAATYQPIISLTTTGTSGAATFTGNVLNVPVYAAGTGTVTSVTSADANATVATTTTTPVITIVSAPKLQTARTIAITGDLVYTSPSFDGSANVTAAGTLATVNANVGTFGSATQVAQVTVNAKGLTTAASNVTITPAASSITGGAALTKVDDTNVTLTLGGSPTTALLAATSITAGWTGTLADSRITSAATWNAKQNALSGTGYAKWAGTTPSYLSPTQVTADLNLFTSALQGLVPLSGGGSTNFLRADGTWAAAGGSGWGLTGNAGLSSPTNYIGTNSNVSMNFHTNSTYAMTLDSNGRLGLLTRVPTHSLTFGNTTTGYAHYNTSTLTTNFERFSGAWVGNVYTMQTEKLGTGVSRSINITSLAQLNGSAATTMTFGGASSSTFGSGAANSTTTIYSANSSGAAVTMVLGGSQNGFLMNSTSAPNNGSNEFVNAITATVGGSGTKDLLNFYGAWAGGGAVNGIRVSPNITNTNPSMYLMNLGVNSATTGVITTHTPKFLVDKDGNTGIATVTVTDGSVLDVASTTKYMLIPRMTTTQRDAINVLGVTAGTLAAGSGYTNGTYTANALTGGTGTGATATIIIASGNIVTVTIVANGKNYVIGDVLSTSGIGAGAGFTFTITALTDVGGASVFSKTTGTTDIFNGVTWSGFTTSAAGTLTLKYGNDYVFTGTTATYTLPSINAALVGRQNAIKIKNRGSGSITLNTATGSTLYTTTTASSITIVAGAAVELLPDGTYNLVLYNL